jgi:hypothetical protein
MLIAGDVVASRTVPEYDGWRADRGGTAARVAAARRYGLLRLPRRAIPVRRLAGVMTLLTGMALIQIG